MKNKIATLLLVILCVSGIQCRTVLERKYVANLKVVETRSDDHTRLEISGLAFSSALAVEGIRTRTEGSDLILRIMLVPAHRGLSGSFVYMMAVPAGVTRVLFGDERKQIWPVLEPR